jgi:hypothetical protein
MLEVILYSLLLYVRDKFSDNIIVAYLVKIRIMEPEETSTTREHHGNNMWLCVFYAVRVTFPQQEGCTKQ